MCSIKHRKKKQRENICTNLYVKWITYYLDVQYLGHIQMCFSITEKENVDTFGFAQVTYSICRIWKCCFRLFLRTTSLVWFVPGSLISHPWHFRWFWFCEVAYKKSLLRKPSWPKQMLATVLEIARISDPFSANQTRPTFVLLSFDSEFVGFHESFFLY